MPIIVPEQQQAELGRSRITPVDTYAKAAVPQNEDGGLGALSNALKHVGVNLGGFFEDQQSKQDAEDLRNIDYLAGQARAVRDDVASGGPVAAQSNPMLAAKSPTVLRRVDEKLGLDDGSRWAMEHSEELYAGIDLRRNPELLEQRIAQKKAQALEVAGANPSYGQGFVKSVNSYFDKLSSAAHGERASLLQTEQRSMLRNDTLTRAKAAAEGSQLQWSPIGSEGAQNLRTALVQGKSPEHIDNLQKDFASRLDRMIAEAPPEIKSQLGIMSGFRSSSRQSEIYQDAVKKYGSEEAARKWAAPPGRSMHNHGEAVDLKYASPAARQWAHDNAEKYGLYFPMGHEPWHIEMVGGRRQGGKGETHDTDGEDDDDIVSSMVRKTAVIESNNNPNRASSTTSALGTHQLMKDEFLEWARTKRPDLTKGKTEAQILALRRDPAISAEMATEKVAGNKARLENLGLPVNETNMYLTYFAGIGDGPKIIHANDGAPIESIMQPKSISANPWLKGKTVGEVKQWAADKVGAATDGTSRARNALRGTNRVWSVSSSLDEIVRRNDMASSLMEAATKTGETKYLDWMPPELMTPELEVAFAGARDAAVQHKMTRYRQEKAFEEDQRRETSRQMMDGIAERVAKGETFSPADVAWQDGKFNREAFEYASKAKETLSTVDAPTSERNAQKFLLDVEQAGLTGKWGEFMGDPKYDTSPPTAVELMDRVRTTSGIRANDQIQLIQKIPLVRDAVAAATDTVVNTRFRDDVKPILEAFKTSPHGQIAKVKGIDIETEGKRVLQDHIADHFKAYAEEKGEPPRGTARLDIIEKGVAKAKARVEEVIKAIRDNKPVEAKSPENAKAIDKPRFKEEVDPVTGIIKLTRVSSAASGNPSKPTEVEIKLPQIDPVLTRIMDEYPDIRKYVKGS